MPKMCSRHIKLLDISYTLLCFGWVYLFSIYCWPWKNSTVKRNSSVFHRVNTVRILMQLRMHWYMTHACCFLYCGIGAARAGCSAVISPSFRCPSPRVQLRTLICLEGRARYYCLFLRWRRQCQYTINTPWTVNMVAVDYIEAYFIAFKTKYWSFAVSNIQGYGFIYIIVYTCRSP